MRIFLTKKWEIMTVMMTIQNQIAKKQEDVTTKNLPIKATDTDQDICTAGVTEADMIIEDEAMIAICQDEVITTRIVTDDIIPGIIEKNTTIPRKEMLTDTKLSRK